ncbi:MAG: nicotinate (nicotinamide) nucleotide adenylyltransferase [Oscillospiraceae bacterium]|nr:nicotinate (nicotinamide) nucleotide adenylyltransferase [Oscillospiraceae bacterium]
MKIGIFGGTFDPPHLGHMEAVRTAVEQLELDKLLFIPARTPPHKNLPEDGASPAQRLEMTQLMADGLRMPDVVQVSGLELEREGKSYTADTLRQLHQRFPQDELWLLMGSDMFLSLHRWSRPEEIMALAGIAAFDRTQQLHGAPMEEQAEFLRNTYRAQVRLVPLPQVRELASNQIREQGTGEGLWPPVWGYILRFGLYGVHKPLDGLNLQDLRAVSYSMIRAKRIPHVQGTEEEAARLARRWGAPEEQARRAGILHDCTKYLTLEEHLQLCRRYQVPLDEIERETVSLLHAKSGAALAAHVFGQPEPVVQAIRFHTTGRADMTLLEKILYIADYMEPNRTFSGVERLRELAYEDLDAAVALGAAMSIQQAQERGGCLHPNTQAALNFLRENQ